MRNYHLRKTIWGYHKRDVDSYLAELKQQLKEKNVVIDDLRQKLRSAEYENEDLLDKLRVCQQINKTLKMSGDKSMQENEQIPSPVRLKSRSMGETGSDKATAEIPTKTENDHARNEYTKGFDAG